jgi:5S rRNA maturation endonuclease (ribonuclease M5)
MYRDWNAVNNLISQDILGKDAVLDLLVSLGSQDVKVNHCGNSYRTSCPIHLGDDPNLHVCTDGDVLPIHWACHSNHCEDVWKKSLLGLVRGVLSVGKQKPVHPAVAEDYLIQFLGGKLSDTPRILPSTTPKHSTAKRLHLTHDQVRGTLVIPSPYYVSRGFSTAILDLHDVGFSAKRNATLVPLYDDAGEVCVGFMTRSELPGCDDCKLAHQPGQPCSRGVRRWNVMEEFPKADYLYNYHRALVSPQQILLLVEGPGDVWRAEEAGYMAIGLLGSDLTSQQLQKLIAITREPLKSIFIVMDSDDVGRKAAARIESMLERKHILRHVVRLPRRHKDVGEIPVDDFRRVMEKEVNEPYRPGPGLAR